MLLKRIPSKKKTHKLIFIILKFIAEKGHAFSLAFMLKNVDIYSFHTPYDMNYTSPNSKNSMFLKTIRNLDMNSNTFLRGSCVPN